MHKGDIIVAWGNGSMTRQYSTSKMYNTRYYLGNDDILKKLIRFLFKISQSPLLLKGLIQCNIILREKKTHACWYGAEKKFGIANAFKKPA